MALRLRRGSDAQRLTITPADGELIYENTNKRLFVGDGVTVGGNGVSAPVTSVNAKVGAVALTSDDIPEGTNKFYYTNNKALDAVGAMFQGGTHTNISFTYNETTNVISAVSAGAYTNNDAVDAVGAALLAGNNTNTGITFSYATETNTITATVSASGSGTVGAGTAGQIPYYAATGSAVAAIGANLTWTPTGNILTHTDGVLNLVSELGDKAVVRFDAYHGNVIPTSFALRRARNTLANPSAVQTGDILNSIVFSAHDGTGFMRAGAIVSAISGAVATGKTPNSLLFETTNLDGISDYRLRISDEGVVTIGPVAFDDTGTGQLLVRQSVTASVTPILNLRTTFADQFGPVIGLFKQRGTQAAPATAIQNDVTGDIKSYAFDGTTFRLSTIIRTIVDSPITGGRAPGAIQFGFSNLAGALVFPTKISGATGISVLSHTGQIAATGTVFAGRFETTGAGAASVVSTTTLDLSSPIAVKVIGGGTFRLPLLDATARTAIIAVNGDMIYNTTENKVQAYQNGFWINLDGTV
jgi:hypothetical protein